MKATAIAHPNIALVKYWGKRDASLNLPHNGSISVTLASISTRTSIEFISSLEHDQVVLNGTSVGGEGIGRISRFVDLFRERAGQKSRARIVSDNDFPTAAGLASSSSGYAALAMAASEALGLRLSRQELSSLARQGSGSACRSIHGGYVEWRRGELEDGSDSVAVPLAPANYWPLSVLIAVTSAGSKPVSSREAMNRTVATSPYYPAWVAQVPAELEAARTAIFERSLEKLGPVAEQSCLRMFATMLGADPPIQYWLPASVAVMRAVLEKRAEGVPAWFTLDAGPNVKVLCAPDAAGEIARWLGVIPGVDRVLHCHVGGPAERIS